MPGGREKTQCDEFVVVESAYFSKDFIAQTLNITQMCALTKARGAGPLLLHQKGQDR